MNSKSEFKENGAGGGIWNHDFFAHWDFSRLLYVTQLDLSHPLTGQRSNIWASLWKQIQC